MALPFMLHSNRHSLLFVARLPRCWQLVLSGPNHHGRRAGADTDTAESAVAAVNRPRRTGARQIFRCVGDTRRIGGLALGLQQCRQAHYADRRARTNGHHRARIETV